eukprot:366329-Chlamydomonas_euryale.AAC.8
MAPRMVIGSMMRMRSQSISGPWWFGWRLPMLRMAFPNEAPRTVTLPAGYKPAWWQASGCMP